MVCLAFRINFLCVYINDELLERPRFINLSNSLQISSYYSTVTFICHIYGVPVPTISWYKIIEKIKQQPNTEEELELLTVDSRQ